MNAPLDGTAAGGTAGSSDGSSDGNVAGNTYDKYASTNPIEQRMMRGFFDALDRMLEGLRPEVVVEVGAGEGRVTERLVERFPDAAVIGLDLVDDDLAGDWAELGLPMFFGDATRLPFRDDSVDLVVGLEVMEHIPSPERALADIQRVCRGTVVLSVPREPIWRAGNLARGRYLRHLGNTPGHVNHWSSRAFERFVGGRLAVESVARPLPWTMLRGRPR
ncbi:MAG: class I SAM-dependent methyltransferase [Ilumatobacter sp.]|nr:class I SAM-dependent methyltransferase [Ilumatobacter sp.]